MTERGLELETRTLGVSDSDLELHDPESTREVGIHMLSQARQQLLLFSQELAAELYDQQPFLEALQILALNGPHVRIQILVVDSQKAVKQGHRLLELARRLTSRIEIRRPIAEYRERGDEFLLVDGSGYIHRRIATVYEGIANYQAPLAVRHLQESFREAWEHSEPDQELRRLFL